MVNVFRRKVVKGTGIYNNERLKKRLETYKWLFNFIKYTCSFEFFNL